MTALLRDYMQLVLKQAARSMCFCILKNIISTISIVVFQKLKQIQGRFLLRYRIDLQSCELYQILLNIFKTWIDRVSSGIVKQRLNSPGRQRDRIPHRIKCTKYRLY